MLYAASFNLRSVTLYAAGLRPAQMEYDLRCSWSTLYAAGHAPICWFLLVTLYTAGFALRSWSRSVSWVRSMQLVTLSAAVCALRCWLRSMQLVTHCVACYNNFELRTMHPSLRSRLRSTQQFMFYAAGYAPRSTPSATTWPADMETFIHQPAVLERSSLRELMQSAAEDHGVRFKTRRVESDA